jgi:hypothetical protein
VAVIEYTRAAAPVRPREAETAGALMPQATATAPASADTGRARLISYDHLSLGLKAGDRYDRSLITPQVAALNGKHVLIRGYIHPDSVYVMFGIQNFIMTRDSGECCFGPNAVLDHLMYVTMNPGRTADYTDRPVAVQGTLHLEEIANPHEPQGGPAFIYWMSAEVVE